MKISKQTGLKRILYAARYSYQGLKHNIIKEAAFRQAVSLALIFVTPAFFMDV